MPHEHDNEKEIERDEAAESGEPEITLENEDQEAGIEGSAAVKKLRDRLKLAEAEKQEYLTGWQKTKAEYINSRKRDEDEKRALAKFAQADLLEELLPTLDSFDSALAHAAKIPDVPTEWQKGMQGIYNQLLSTLAARGLKQVNPLGEPFDPSFHEAIGMIDTDKPTEDHVILDVLQKGYTLYDKTLRTARVRVGHFTENIEKK